MTKDMNKDSSAKSGAAEHHSTDAHEHHVKTPQPTVRHEVEELTADLQRLRADFENYRKRVETDQASLRELTKAATVMKLLPVVDNIERAVAHIPADLQANSWAQGVVSLVKSLDKSLAELGLVRIEASPGTPFDPNAHEAIAMDDGEGEHEVIAQELRAGYRMGEQVIRPVMVRVKRQ